MLNWLDEHKTYCRWTFFCGNLFSQLGGYFKTHIDIFTAEKPRLGSYGMKAETEYNSFLNRGCDIFADCMSTAKTAEIW